jgi:hypothetical protein
MSDKTNVVFLAVPSIIVSDTPAFDSITTDEATALHLMESVSMYHLYNVEGEDGRAAIDASTEAGPHYEYVVQNVEVPTTVIARILIEACQVEDGGRRLAFIDVAAHEDHHDVRVVLSTTVHYPDKSVARFGVLDHEYVMKKVDTLIHGYLKTLKN